MCICVCLYVSLFAYSSRRDKPICTKLASVFLQARERTYEGQNPIKSVLSSIPGESGSCSSENKHNIRTAPRPKLFVSNRRLQKHRPQPRKNCLGFDSR
jgi:hypothetical protein